MDNGMVTTSDLLRLVGVTSIFVGVAWALQVLGLAPEAVGFGRLMWVVGAAAVAGGGVGAIYIASLLRANEEPAGA